MTMRVLVDACVLYSTVPRALVVGAAKQGLIVPLWSERILDEWRRAVAREGPVAAEQVATEIALARLSCPYANVAVPDGLVDTLSLPDPDDRHVLAAAISGQASVLLTRNMRDFPPRTLARHGISPRAPDSLFLDLWTANPDSVTAIAVPVVDAMGQAAGIAPRDVLKRAGLPRFGKALARA
jgi:predicted nucleic acid-binding protein